MMLAECSKVEMIIDVEAIPAPFGVVAERWLTSFPSFGFLLSLAAENVEAVIAAFAARDIAAADIGSVQTGSRVMLKRGHETATVWDFAEQDLLGCVK